MTGPSAPVARGDPTRLDGPLSGTDSRCTWPAMSPAAKVRPKGANATELTPAGSVAFLRGAPERLFWRGTSHRGTTSEPLQAARTRPSGENANCRMHRSGPASFPGGSPVAASQAQTATPLSPAARRPSQGEKARDRIPRRPARRRFPFPARDRVPQPDFRVKNARRGQRAIVRGKRNVGDAAPVPGQSQAHFPAGRIHEFHGVVFIRESDRATVVRDGQRAVRAKVGPQGFMSRGAVGVHAVQ